MGQLFVGGFSPMKIVCLKSMCCWSPWKLALCLKGTPISTCKSYLLIGGYIITFRCIVCKYHSRMKESKRLEEGILRHHPDITEKKTHESRLKYAMLISQACYSRSSKCSNAPIFPCPSARAMEAVWYRNHSSNLLTHLKIDPKNKALGGSHENWCTLDTSI